MIKNVLLCLVGIFVFMDVLSGYSEVLADIPPEITPSLGKTEFVPGEGAVIIDPGILVTDEDSPNASKAVVKLANRPDGGNEFINITSEVVNLAANNGLMLNYDFTNGELVITGSASMGVYQDIFRKLLYNNLTAIPDIADRLVNFTIFDEEGLESVTATKVVEIRNVTAVITNIEVSDDDLYGIGDGIAVTFTFNRPVIVQNGPPFLVFNIGGEEVMAHYDSGSGTNQLVFQYTVKEGDEDTDGIVVTPEIMLDGATIKDETGAEADLSISGFPSTAGILVDGIRPYAATVSLPADEVYGICEGTILTFKLSLSEQVTVSGNPLLQIALNSGNVAAAFDAEASTNVELVFNYEVVQGNNDTDGIEVSGLNLNGGTIRDLADNDWTDLGLELSDIPEENDVIVDTTPPDVPVVTGISPDTGASETDGISNTPGLTISGTSEANVLIKVNIDGEVAGETTSNESGEWALDITEQELAEGEHVVTATATDEVCNESAPSEPLNILVDLTAPNAMGRNLTVQLNAEGSVSISTAQVNDGSTDNFTASEDLFLELDQETFTCEHIGENEVILTVRDIAGNVSTVTVTVVVENKNAPSVVTKDITVQLDENGQVTISPEDVNDGTSSVCYNTEQMTFELNQTTFGCGELGANTVTLTVTDPDGNMSSQEATVTVEDDSAPVISGTPENMEVFANADGEFMLANYLEDMEASDNCAVVSFTQSPALNTVLSGYNEPNTITFTATDAAGNETETSFTITLKSNIIAEVTDPDIITVRWGTAIGDLTLPAEVEVTLLSGETQMVEVDWDIDNYESMEPGVYQNSGELVLSDNLLNPSGLAPTVTLVVEEKEPPLDIMLSNNTFSINMDLSTSIGTFTTEDPDDNVHTYALSGSSQANSYFTIAGDKLYWDTDEALLGQEEFTITVSSTDREGNTITKSFVIVRTKPSLNDLEIPNVFSPNGDGINDGWTVEILQYYTGVKILVFERSGKLLYTSDDPMERWDGNFEGKEMPVGSYFYAVEVTETGEKRRGVLTLIRD